MTKDRLTLGLDLGTNSVGWALVRHDSNGIAREIVAAGVRIFQEAVDGKTRVPKNQQRRAARAVRRILARRRRRKARLQRLLVREGFLPPNLTEASKPEALFNAIGDPYVLRKRGLDEPLEPHEVGRVLVHLCARRGFQSNRKSLLGLLAQEFDDLIEASELTSADKADGVSKRTATDEEGQVKSAIKALAADMRQRGARTLGEYLADLPRDERKRGRYTDRQMFKDEFEAFWASQARFHEKLRADEFKAQVFMAIFFQRPLKSAKRFVGRCSLEPSRKRTAVARLEAQKFRILQDVNHLEVRDPATRLYKELDAAQKEKLCARLMGQKTLSWGEARKLLGLHKSETFNLEDAGRDHLKGNITACSIERIIGDRWMELTPKDRLDLVEDLLTIADKGHLIKRLREHWGFSREQQFRLATLELEPGYMSHSLKAINRLLPALEKGAKYHEARLAAGYDFETKQPTLERLPIPPVVRNPVVQRALNETRRVVNAVIRKYGRLGVIRVEMARDLKLTGRRKEQYERQQRLNEKANRRAREQLQGLGVEHPSRDDLLKFRLWEECGGVCPYTGRPISMHQLFGPQVDIDHIIPYSRSLDDSYMNKTVCFADENRGIKRSQTPWEAYGGDAKAWEGIIQRTKKLSVPIAKQRRFLLREVPSVDEFISRQLNDTRYVSVEVKNYLAKLGCKVEVTKGVITADLRRVWGLNGLLGFDAEKKVRTDHRHHALDAIVIALSDRSRYQKLASASQRSGDNSLQHGRLAIEEPWADFKTTVQQALAPIVVSHAVNRKIVGAFHEATAYGFHAGTGKYHYRKRLDSTFSPKAVKNIADPVIQRLVRERLSAFGDDPKKAFAQPLFHLNGRTPIRSVRLAKNASDSSVFGVGEPGEPPYKFYELGSNHHVEIFEDETTKRRSGRVVTMLAAATRVRRERKPIVDRHWDGKRFVMSLCINDMVEIESDGRRELYCVQKISSDTEITFRHHLAATIENNAERRILRASTLKGRKVAVDAVGHVSYASD